MKNLLFIFLTICLTIATFVSMVLIKPINTDTSKKEKTESLELWHIDMFEGGTGSRSAFLKNLGDKYSKKYNVSIVIKNHSEYSAYQSFEKGIYPDIISYSLGFKLPYDRIKKLKNGNGLGSYNGEIYAQPWCGGGYVYIARKNEKIDGLIISQQKYTFPRLACYYSDITLPIKEEIESDKAIYSFYRNKNYAFIGTQRDLFRLSDKGMDLIIEPLKKYCDLYQYMSVIAEKENYSISCDFINYILKEIKNNGLLNKIGMLPVEKYQSGEYSQILSIFKNVNYSLTTDLFSTYEDLQKLKNLSVDCKQNIESIKNLVKTIEIK